MRDPKTNLIKDMLHTFELLGNSRWARIDARVWHEYFKRRINKIYDTKNTHDNRRGERRKRNPKGPKGL